MNNEHLIKTLTVKKDREQKDEVFEKLKQFVTKYSPNDFAK